MRILDRLTGAAVVSLALLVQANAADWPRFRGPNGSGVAPAGEKIPTAWSDNQHIAWKVELPGPGSSSPVIVNDRVFVTCYTGYGVAADSPGSVADLRRHLFCFDAKSGKQLWEATVPGVAGEDPYRGFINEHGYASSSPVASSDRVFVFFGKSGVLAYDLNGKELWKTSVGLESGPQHWGSAASPILFQNMVIVNAAEESQSIVALDQSTGKELWRATAGSLDSTWGTPIVVGEGDDAVIAIGVPNEIWGLNPKTGKLRWFADALQDNTYCSSLVTDGKLVYGIEGRQSQSIAIKTGGKGDVTQTHVAWKGRAQGKTASPIAYDGRLYSTSRGTAQCLDATTGEQIYQSRFPQSDGSPAADNESRRPGPPGGGGRGGGMGGQDYPSPILVDGKLYLMTRSGTVFVWEAGPQFNFLTQNRIASDSSRYNGTPAVSNNRLFLRSDKALYCIAESK